MQPTVDRTWCYPPRPCRVWHRRFGEGKVVAGRFHDDATEEYEVIFHWAGRRVVIEPEAQLVWLDKP